MFLLASLGELITLVNFSFNCTFSPFSVDYCATLVLSYKKDIQIKEAILKDILINQSRDIQTIYIASWQMQVYIQKCTPLKSILSSEFPD